MTGTGRRTGRAIATTPRHAGLRITPEEQVGRDGRTSRVFRAVSA